MRKRLVFAVLCILALPLLFSLPQNGKLTTSAPFASVALAGRNTMGGWCQCGCNKCICDPGEESVLCMQGGSSPASDRTVGRPAAPSGRGFGLGLDFGSGAMLLALAFFAWTRFRASGF